MPGESAPFPPFHRPQQNQNNGGRSSGFASIAGFPGIGEKSSATPKKTPFADRKGADPGSTSGSQMTVARIPPPSGQPRSDTNRANNQLPAPDSSQFRQKPQQSSQMVVAKRPQPMSQEQQVAFRTSDQHIQQPPEFSQFLSPDLSSSDMMVMVLNRKHDEEKARAKTSEALHEKIEDLKTALGRRDLKIVELENDNRMLLDMEQKVEQSIETLETNLGLQEQRGQELLREHERISKTLNEANQRSKDFESKLNKLQHENETLKKACLDAGSRISDLRSRLHKAEESIEAKEASIKDTQSKIDGLKDQKIIWLQDKAALEGKVGQAALESKEQKDFISRLEQKIAELNDGHTQSKDKIGKLERELTEAQEKLIEEVQRAEANAKIATSIHEQELEGVKVDCAKSIKALEDTIANLQEQIQEKDARLSRHAEEETERTTKITDLESQIEERTTTITKLESQIAELQTNLATKTNEKEEIETSLALVKRESDGFQSELTAAQDEIESLRESILKTNADHLNKEQAWEETKLELERELEESKKVSTKLNEDMKRAQQAISDLKAQLVEAAEKIKIAQTPVENTEKLDYLREALGRKMSEMEQLQVEHAMKVEQLNAESKQLQNEIGQLKKKHADEIAQLKQKLPPTSPIAPRGFSQVQAELAKVKTPQGKSFQEMVNEGSSDEDEEMQDSPKDISKAEKMVHDEILSRSQALKSGNVMINLMADQAEQAHDAIEDSDTAEPKTVEREQPKRNKRKAEEPTISLKRPAKSSNIRHSKNQSKAKQAAVEEEKEDDVEWSVRKSQKFYKTNKSQTRVKY